MDIKFLRVYNEPGDYWAWSIFKRYDFEIGYDTEKNFERYAKELRLNIKYQFNHNHVQRTK